MTALEEFELTLRGQYHGREVRLLAQVPTQGVAWFAIGPMFEDEGGYWKTIRFPDGGPPAPTGVYHAGGR
jgi:hypothetical protein